MKPIIVANWKMNPATLTEARQLFNSLAREIKNIKNADIVICPPFSYLAALKSEKNDLHLGAQDCYWEEKGAFTGAISAAMLASLGCRYVILGHSERRRYFNETDEMINKKIAAALNKDLKPILCIGETDTERKAGQTFDILEKQLKKNLPEINNVIIAYEPVWAIGTGNCCETEKAKEVQQFLWKFIKNTPILYGGSVNSQNSGDYIDKSGFNGLLVGGASLDSSEFMKIINSLDKRGKSC
jgi:triosephosphate isomerase